MWDDTSRFSFCFLQLVCFRRRAVGFRGRYAEGKLRCSDLFLKKWDQIKVLAASWCQRHSFRYRQFEWSCLSGSICVRISGINWHPAANQNRVIIQTVAKNYGKPSCFSFGRLKMKPRSLLTFTQFYGSFYSVESQQSFYFAELTHTHIWSHTSCSVWCNVFLFLLFSS